MGFFAKLNTCPSKVDVFLFYFYSESPKNLLQDVGSLFFSFIIFFSIITLEKLYKYQKNQIICFIIKLGKWLYRSKFYEKFEITIKISLFLLFFIKNKIFMLL